MLDNNVVVLRELLQEHRLDAILILSPVNLRYLCGFTGTDGGLIVTANNTIFLTDSRYTTQATEEVNADQCLEYSVQVDGIVTVLEECKVSLVGFESNFLTVAALDRLRDRCEDRVEWIALDRPIMTMRGIKSSLEISALERAAHLSATAFDEIVQLIRPGISEREIALVLEFSMRRLGGDDKSFDLIVASGERGALPHGTASQRLITTGEFVTIDFGLRLNGYCSDETVTIAIGVVDAELERIYDVVYHAQQCALAAIRPGVPLKEIDAAARNYIVDAGYGKFFGHGLGHGVGLDVHEYPTLSPRSSDTAQVGMVFTVEPGIYLPGKGGVRLEDMVVVTPEGCRKLTRIPKELRQLY